MYIEIKPGVTLLCINDHFIAVCNVVYQVLSSEFVKPVFTAGNDGKHMDGSYHYTGEAWDFRSHGLAEPQETLEHIKIRLQSMDTHYDVVFEDTGENEHFHVEWDKKKGKV